MGCLYHYTDNILLTLYIECHVLCIAYDSIVQTKKAMIHLNKAIFLTYVLYAMPHINAALDWSNPKPYTTPQ